MRKSLKNILAEYAVHIVLGILAALVVVSVTNQLTLTLLIVLLAGAMALLIILAKTGKARPLLLFGLGFSLIINPNKTFEDPANFFGYGGVMNYYVALSDLILILLIAALARPEKTVVYRERAPLAGKFSLLLLCAYLAWTLISVFSAGNHTIAFTQWLYEIRGALIFIFMGVMLIRLPGKELGSALRLVLFGLSCAILFETLIVIGEYLGLMANVSLLGIKVGSFDENLGGVITRRVGGTYLHPNALAMPMATLMPFLAVKAIDNRERFLLRLVFGAAALGAALCLALTLSRGALLGLGAAIFIGLVLFISISGGLSFMRKNFRYFAAAGICLGILAIIFSGPIYRKFTESDPDNVASRLNLNQLAIEIISDYPLAGAGLNNANVVGPGYSYYRLYEMIFRIPPVVHNIYLLLASEIGIIGVIIWLIFILSALATGIRALYVPKLTMNDKLIIIALIIGVMNFLISDMVGYSIRLLELGYLFWWELGLLFGLGRYIRNRTYEEHSAPEELSSGPSTRETDQRTPMEHRSFAGQTRSPSRQSRHQEMPE